MRFPVLSQTRFTPYTPRHTYRAPAGGARSVPRRQAFIAAIAKTFTKDVILLTRADGDSVPRGSRRSVLYEVAELRIWSISSPHGVKKECGDTSSTPSKG